MRHLCFLFFILFFDLNCSCFTVLYQFLLYSKVTQAYIYMHSFFNVLFIIVYPQRLDVVPCAMYWTSSLSLFFFFVVSPFLGPLLQHMEVPRLGVESEL